MKTLLTGILLIFFLPHFLISQELKIDEKTGLYTKQAVVEIDSMTKGQLYKRAIEWITLNYKSANDVIQLKDEDGGKLILKGNFSISIMMTEGWIRHTLILDFKDNKFRYQYTDFLYTTGTYNWAFESSAVVINKKKIFSETDANIEKSISSLKEYILKNKKTKDNW